MAPIWDILGPYSPKYCFILLNLWPEVVSDQKNSIWEILQDLEFWPKRNTVNLNILGPYWCPIYCRKTKNIAKTKISTKTACLAIINNVSPTSHKNHRILVKLSWKYFLGPNWVYITTMGQRVITIHLYFLAAKFQLLCICRFRL